MLLEGPMIIIACMALSVFHPAVGFQGYWHEAGFVLWERYTFRKHAQLCGVEKRGGGGKSDEECMI